MCMWGKSSGINNWREEDGTNDVFMYANNIFVGV